MCEPTAAILKAPRTPAALVRAEALERKITDLCARINAANYRLLRLIAELDDADPWGAWGLASCAHWLNWRCGIGLNAAREKVRVAHALKKLPAIGAAFAAGELSFSKVRAVTRIADSANEAELLNLARHATAAQVETLVRGYRRAGRAEESAKAAAAQAACELHYFYDDDGSLVIRARLPADDGAVVVEALNAALDALEVERHSCAADDVTAVTPDAKGGEEQSGVSAGVAPAPADKYSRRCADALTLMAETMLRYGAASLSAAERYRVVVHVTAETLASDAYGRCELEEGQHIAIDTARRIACDAGLLRISENADGHPLDIGRKTRAVPLALRRALEARDGGCRFPGCTRRRRVDAHHIRHWADGGETSLDNLVLLCRRHHRLVHEGGFAVARDAGGRPVFTRPDGRVIDAAPRLPVACDAGTGDPLCPGTNPLPGEAVNASAWVIPSGTLDYGIAIEGLLRTGQRKTARVDSLPPPG